ncbi:MAG: hypothetical protein JWL89_374 [Candidatus Saccharibacteria bacterium]|nr:hypothetical protein [Candidatus Saccharibacteria bacterium]
MAELADFDFPELIQPPTASYAATLALHREVGQHHADVTYESMWQFALNTYRNFGEGGGDQLPVAVDTQLDDALAYTTDYENYERFGVWPDEEQVAVAKLAHRYLKGEGDDYEAFKSIAL